MTCKPTAVRNGAQAATYFEEDYYTKEGDQSPSVWEGQLAAQLGLAGAVNKSDFLKTLNGSLPSGETVQKGASAKHRPATDMTFSPPKSVSLAAFGAGDLRVAQVHREAVSAAMAWAECNLIVARVTKDGKTEEVKSGNMLAARFSHDLSRNLDPQLHDHFLVLNATRTEDGKLRAIDNHKLFEAQMLLGAVYHSELQRGLENLGYQTEVTLKGTNGEFEIAGIDADYLEEKSSRRAAIIASLEARGIDPATATARQKQIAALDTRKAKGEVDREIIFSELQTEFRDALPDFKIPEALTAEQISARDLERAIAVKAALDWATEHHFERSNAVKREDLIKTAIAESHGATVVQIESEFERRLMAGELLTDGKRFTTKEAIERERFMIETVRNGQGGKEAIYSPDAALTLLADAPLNDGQRKAAGMMMCAEDQFALISGVAGSGKTHMLKVAQPLLEAQGYKLIGVAPSHQAASELCSAMGEGMTVQSFNQSPSIHKTLNANSIIVMDEAGLCDAKTMAQFSAIVKETGTRAVFIGDNRQFKAVGAGNPYLLLQEQGIRQSEMNESRRQDPNPELKATVDLAAEGKMVKALARLPVHEIKGDAARHDALAADYVATRATLMEQAAAGDRHAAKGVILLTGSNADRRAINNSIREKLGLKGIGEEITVLDRENLTAAEQKLLRSYKPGQVLKFSQAYQSLGVAAGGMLTVERIEKASVICRHIDGRELTFHPNRLNPANWQVMRAEKMEFSPGDEIRFRQNQKDPAAEKGQKIYLYNTNDRGVVINIDRDARTLTIRNEGKKGREITLSLNDPQFVTHAYAMTGHSAQGATVHTAICDFRGKSLTTSRESFYTDISRATTEVRIYTDDAEGLRKNAERAIEKPNAMDVSMISSVAYPEVAIPSEGNLEGVSDMGFIDNIKGLFGANSADKDTEVEQQKFSGKPTFDLDSTARNDVPLQQATERFANDGNGFDRFEAFMTEVRKPRDAANELADSTAQIAEEAKKKAAAYSEKNPWMPDIFNPFAAKAAEAEKVAQQAHRDAQVANVKYAEVTAPVRQAMQDRAKEIEQERADKALFADVNKVADQHSVGASNAIDSATRNQDSFAPLPEPQIITEVQGIEQSNLASQVTDQNQGLFDDLFEELEQVISAGKAPDHSNQNSGIQWHENGDSYISKEGNRFVRDEHGDFAFDPSYELEKAQDHARYSEDDKALSDDLKPAVEAGVADIKDSYSADHDNGHEKNSEKEIGRDVNNDRDAGLDDGYDFSI